MDNIPFKKQKAKTSTQNFK